TGEDRAEGGRFGEAPSIGLSASLRRLGFELGRLKTGTPPRLRRSTIDWEGLPEQVGDDPPQPFSQFNDVFPVLPQVACRETRTTPEVHEHIRRNRHRAPMFSGQIESVGPRYCPSIEDKVVRFDRDGHTVFLEPESLEDEWVYCNGIATSLPRDVQDLVVQGLPGCERAEILQYGYAVEYDMVRPHQIDATGMTKSIGGLFLAGQINGTSGYEEAAGQGLLAGCNAARFALGEDLVTIGRDEGYIGVMMDDLVCRTPVEPYRMFTSRAEHRLLLRADNALDRLAPVASRAGLLQTDDGARRLDLLARKRREMDDLHARIEGTRLEGESLATRLRRPAYGLEALRADLPDVEALDTSWITVVAERKYEHYIERQRREIRRQASMERRRLPEDLDIERIPSLRTEAKQALARFRPRTFGQAGRLEGITPADMTLLAVLVRQGRTT
ncbi:MAG: tRNA uridine-5-carboxymethylaminomethyl(34) synthesis enzyme MnmG, partial [Phycisphaerales bacterium]|nr:tRNA uridine-5-carboxymethylaminomethyl(34) synthesis enzyme MnmG [Phycisphaerales bacterium]